MSGYKKGVIAVGLIIGILLQVVILPRIRFWGAGPHLLFLFAVYFGYRFGPKYGFCIGLLAGYLKDMFSLGIIGAHAFSFSICGFILFFISIKFYQGWFLPQFITIFFISLFYSLCYYLFSSLFITLPNFFKAFAEYSLKPGLLTASLAPALFFIMDKIFKPVPKFYQSSRKYDRNFK